MTLTMPQVGLPLPGGSLRAARDSVGGWGCPFGGGERHRGMLRPVHGWAAGSQGGRCPDREPALTSRTRLARMAAARRRPPISALGSEPSCRRRGLPPPWIKGAVAAELHHPGSRVAPGWLGGLAV